MVFFRLFLFAVTMILPSVGISHSVAPEPVKSGCADFLSILHIKPSHVQFVKCELDKNRQGKPLRAIYNVAGIHATAAEDFLVRITKLPHLKKSCCQWDSPPSQITGKDGRTYRIYMVSSETNVKNRKQWRNIPSFEIVVETLTEDI